ncbi:MAG: hypothetical protein GY938_27050 [Ketobacter sp.]|nr:hypothetical protein [Ketobacter sp.]
MSEQQAEEHLLETLENVNAKFKTANDILQGGGLSQQQILAGRIGAVAREQAIRLDTMKLFITAGSELLSEQHGFSTEQTVTWARAVIKRATEYMRATNEQNDTNKATD